MYYAKRIRRFQESLRGYAGAAYIPLSADLQYLSGLKREIPTYGAIRYPGDWLEGLWLASDGEPLLVLTRMTADFHNPDTSNLKVRVLGDFDDPSVLLNEVLRSFDLADEAGFAFGDGTATWTVLWMKERFPKTKFRSASKLIREQRMVKSADEITIMREAGEITEAAFAEVLQRLKHGMTELEILSEIDYQLRAHDSLGASFTSALYCVGPGHSLMFGGHQEAWKRKLHAPVSILFDFGAIHEGYCYDFGRTVVFGEPDDDYRRVYDLVMASQKAGVEAMRAGEVTCAEVDGAARKVIEEAGLGEAFRHRLGHGIGLDVHEPPFLTKSDNSLVQAGMMFTVEPSILFDDKLSARVEDVVLAGEGGGTPLTSGFQELIVVE